ncbi:MAG: histidine phosphatase family protein [Bacilli bacterium]|jgi:broad specificity phosphatase PhoE
MNLYLVRHGEDLPGYRGGWALYPLTQKGRRQISDLADYIIENGISFSYIVSSDLPRAKQSAEILAKKMHKKIIFDSDFREYNNGDLAGMSNAEADKKYPGLYFNAVGMDDHFPHGESPREYFLRISKAYEKIVAKGDDILLITHGGVLDVINHLVHHLKWTNNSPYKKYYKNAELLSLHIK